MYMNFANCNYIWQTSSQIRGHSSKLVNSERHCWGTRHGITGARVRTRPITSTYNFCKVVPIKSVVTKCYPFIQASRLPFREWWRHSMSETDFWHKDAKFWWRWELSKWCDVTGAIAGPTGETRRWLEVNGLLIVSLTACCTVCSC